MYDWIIESNSNTETIITANRHLARLLRKEFAEKKKLNKYKAWRTPIIFSWQDWLVYIKSKTFDQINLPVYINKNQSHLLWEEALQKENGITENQINNLSYLCINTWQRLADWNISITDFTKSIQNKDQRIFASASGRYFSLLKKRNMVDDAGLACLILDCIKKDIVDLSGRYTFVGFVRQRPAIKSIQELLSYKKIEVSIIPATEISTKFSLKSFDNFNAELRAAGDWARKKLLKNPNLRIGIVASNLMDNTDIILRNVREGLIPGWQYSHKSLKEALNVSYGRRLTDYPAIATLNLLLHWLFRNLSSLEIGILLRSPLLDTEIVSGRNKLELKIRQIPDREWSIQMFISEFQSSDNDADVKSWLMHLTELNKIKESLPKFATFNDWVSLIKKVIDLFNWPGQRALSSSDFQLINRWYELLHEFSQLGITNSKINASKAISYLENLTNNTIFQPENKNSIIELLGPLDASGAEFDALWIADVTSSNWPPSRSRSFLISKEIQEKNNMPDCNPSETLHHASLLLKNLIKSSKQTVVSYSKNDGILDQTLSTLIKNDKYIVQDKIVIPNLHASDLIGTLRLKEIEDFAPEVIEGEKIAGGSKTIQRQHENPVSAFLHGRLGIKTIYPQAVGLPASLRGYIIHQALFKLYIDLPSKNSICTWDNKELKARITSAVNFAFFSQEKNADSLLRGLLKYERLRVGKILNRIIQTDLTRPNFKIASVEENFELVHENIKLSLRFDRIDSFDDGTIEILDYKTGTKKRLLNKNNDVEDLQLFVYAMATKLTATSLAFVNIDSRETAFDGVGLNYENDINWFELLNNIKSDISIILKNLSKGDIRINPNQTINDARSLNLLSRFTELYRD